MAAMVTTSCTAAALTTSSWEAEVWTRFALAWAQTCSLAGCGRNPRTSGAIASVMATWTSSGSLSQKRSALKSGVGADGLYKLNLDKVFDDDVIDQVFGEQQDDWFWLFGLDQHDKLGSDATN